MARGVRANGGSTSGVQGSITWAGEWTWSEGGDLTAVTTAVIESSNVTWAPDIPGYDSPDADTLWNNHLAFVHYPNMGAGFHNVTGGSVWEGARDVFTCDPTNNAFGGGDNWWEPGITGTRFVRLWMEAASTTGTVPALPVSGYLMLAGVLLSIGSGGLVRRRA